MPLHLPRDGQLSRWVTVLHLSLPAEGDPYFTGKLQDYTGVEKDEVVLQCEISKADAPVKWFKDGKEIKPSKNVVIKADGKKRMLILKKALKSDIGQYTCDCGTDQTSGKLDIEGEDISMSLPVVTMGDFPARDSRHMLTLHFFQTGRLNWCDPCTVSR